MWQILLSLASAEPADGFPPAVVIAAGVQIVFSILFGLLIWSLARNMKSLDDKMGTHADTILTLTEKFHALDKLQAMSASKVDIEGMRLALSTSATKLELDAMRATISELSAKLGIALERLGHTESRVTESQKIRTGGG